VASSSIKFDDGASGRLVGTGEVSNIMAINLGRFMAEKDDASRNLFRDIRGSEMFCEFIRELRPARIFARMKKQVIGADPWIEAQGYETGVFQRHLLEKWFFPTFQVDKTAALNEIEPGLSEAPQFQKEWNRWDQYKVRLTRNGFIMVIFSRQFTDENLYDLSVELLEPERDEFRLKLRETSKNLAEAQRRQISHIIHAPLQWQLAYQVIKLFIQQLGNIRLDAKKVIHLKMPEEEKKVPIRDQYCVTYLHKLYDGTNGNNEKLSGSEILAKREYGSEILALWDGTLVGDRDKNVIKFPDFSDKEIKKLADNNVSTWYDEICLIGYERAVIYCPLVDQAIYLPFKGENAKEGIQYHDHWKCILRGIEHVIALQAELQMVEAYTNDEMNQVATFTQQLTTRGISRKEKKEIERLARRVANLSNILNLIQEVLVAPSAYRANNAIKKFKKFVDILALDQVEQHVTKNIEKLNTFLSHYNSMVIQQNSDRLQQLALIFGAGIGFLGLASLLTDTRELNDFFKPATLSAAFSKLLNFVTNTWTLFSLLFFWIVIAGAIYALWKLYHHFRS